MDAATIINQLKAQADSKLIEQRKKKFGIESHQALGLTQKQLNETIKGIRKNKSLALALFETNIYEARILCAKLYPPKELTKEQAEIFVQQMENWEICDTFSMKLFARATIAKELIFEWASRESEFVRRAAFATIAGRCLSDKVSPNQYFNPFFKLITQAAIDEQLYVKKAVSWALRSLGKRNIELQETAIDCAEKLLEIPSKSAHWIAKDVLKELRKPSVRIADYPRSIYRQ